ncbi:MAG: hypothetical protein IAF38_18215 [Bacteroidia bacterium]|nr:hypothetical protein [Bacteroidia bacterium]
MKNLIFFLLVFLLIACKEDEVNVSFTKLVELTVDNQSYMLVDEVVSSNENCESVFVSASFVNAEKRKFRISFHLKKTGALTQASIDVYPEISGVIEVLATPTFNPRSIFSVTNFKYDAASKYLYFEFEGEVMEENRRIDKLDIPQARKYMKGKVEIKDVKTSNCSIDALSKLSFSTDNLQFLTSITSARIQTNPVVPNRFTSAFYADNGFKISFMNNDNFGDVPLGTYTFTENTLENIIKFEKYIGIPYYSQIGMVHEQDWKVYQTAGSYTIKEQLKVGTTKVTKGLLNLKVSDSGVFQYQLVDIPYELTSF